MPSGTKTIRSSGGDYTSLTAWESGEQADLTGTGPAIAECYDDWASGLNDNFAISGWTTTASDYVEVRPATGHGHTGTPGSGFYLKPVSASAATIRIVEEFVRITGIDIDGASTSGWGGIDATSTLGSCDIRITRCLVHDNGYYGINLLESLNKVVIANCMIWSNVRGIYSAGAATTVYVYNCTVAANGDYGVLRQVYKNVLSKGHSTGDFFSGQTGSNYNASSDTTAPGANSRISQTFTFADETNKDYHLASSDAGAKDFGTDLSGDSAYAFSNDIDGQTRTGSWDIGADEYVSSGVTVAGAGYGRASVTGISSRSATLATRTAGISLAAGASLAQRNPAGDARGQSFAHGSPIRATAPSVLSSGASSANAAPTRMATPVVTGQGASAANASASRFASASASVAGASKASASPIRTALTTVTVTGFSIAAGAVDITSDIISAGATYGRSLGAAVASRAQSAIAAARGWSAGHSASTRQASAWGTSTGTSSAAGEVLTTSDVLASGATYGRSSAAGVATVLRSVGGAAVSASRAAAATLRSASVVVIARAWSWLAGAIGIIAPDEAKPAIRAVIDGNVYAVRTDSAMQRAVVSGAITAVRISA